MSKRRFLNKTLRVAALAGLSLPSNLLAWDTSPAPILQYFEATYGTIEKRMPDVFKAGYGSLYSPPPGRADTGNFSVGYDQYDRFDLGTGANPTLFGTETGLKTAVNATHRAGVDYFLDLVLNHNGYSTTATSGFGAAGGYPGMNIQLQTTTPGAPGYNTKGYNAADGDFNSAYAYGDINSRLAGLIDINHGTNFQFIRSPVTAGDPNNIPAGTTPAFGRLANVPDPNNRRFYPDKSLQPIMVYDPTTGEANIPIYPFNPNNPVPFNNTPTLYGTPVQENVTGYLMRNTQWLVQAIGVDGFRLDAVKHVEGFTLTYYDRSVYRQSIRYNLDGTQKQIYSFGEAYDGSATYLQTFIRKDINPNTPGVIGGNRDVLNFPAFFALRDNLTNNGLNNSWYNVKNLDLLDKNDDGLMNGSQGVRFVQSHDNYGPDLNNVAHAYSLMMPGQCVVYYNAGQFGTESERGYFPKAGRGDAIGGVYGNKMTDLVKIRDVYAQGNYIERWIEKEIFSFERDKQSITLLSNRTDAGYDSRTLNVNFPWGSHLVELTGNAHNINVAAGNTDIPETVTVFNDFFNGPTKINVRFARNNGGDKGYLIYGLQAPQGSLSLSNLSTTIGSQTTATTGNAHNDAYNNATQRASDIKVVTANTFGITLNTNAVTLGDGYRDFDADGDNALIKIDEGVDVNGNGHVDYTAQGAAYGFEEFTGTKITGINSANHNGTYAQTVNVANLNLSEGMHYVTVRAFRRRTDGGPAVYQDFKEAVYVDRFKPVSSYNSNKPVVISGVTQNENRDFFFRSTDQTANSMHVFLDLPANLTEAQILAMIGGGSQADVYDRDIFKKYFSGLTNGNHVFTVVSYEMTGNYNVQRFSGVGTVSPFGRGVGDLNFNGVFDTGDLSGAGSFEQVFYSHNDQFNPAADLNGDGLVDGQDLLLMKSNLTTGGASSPTLAEWTNVLRRRADVSQSNGFTPGDIDLEKAKIGSLSGRTAGANEWIYDINSDGQLNQADLDAMVQSLLGTNTGDVNLDGIVNFSDLTTLLQNYNRAGGWSTGNFNLGSLYVDFNDLSLLLDNYTPGPLANVQYFTARLDPAAMALLESRGFQTVPEPASLGLLAVSSAMLLRRRRRHHLSNRKGSAI